MNFKFNAVKVFLTYPKCPLTKEEVLESLQTRYSLRFYTISEEKHADGSPHLHAVLVFSERVHRTDPRCFDLGVYHPHIKNLKTQKDLEEARRYTCKDNVFITNVTEVVSKRTQLAQTLIEYGRIDKKIIIENPDLLFLNYSSISSWLSYVRKPVEVLPPTLKLRHLWFHGPSNCGKTHLLRIVRSYFAFPAELPTNNDYRAINDHTDLLYLDEYKGDLSVQTLNRLCDGDTKLNTKGGSTLILYPKVIICSNYSIRDCYRNIEDHIYDSLLNRFEQYDLSIKPYLLPPFIIEKVNV